MPGAFTCRDCRGAGAIGPSEAKEHADRGHDVRRLPEEREPQHVPHDAGHVGVFRGERVGRRRADY